MTEIFSIARLEEEAKNLGFVACGFSSPERPLYFDKFSAWLSDQKNADMSWLERNVEIREDPTRLLKGCKSIISLAYPYVSQKPATPEGLTVSRYSQPTKKDYHARLKDLSEELVDMIGDIYPGNHSRICVDSAPILEKSFAASSGIGFIGKNSMLIIPGHGSYFYLAEILTTANLGSLSMEPMEEQCGTCKRCIDSCPTGALEKPFYLDASKCISYLTIEHKGGTKRDVGRKMGNCFFGCDRCQEVCPFNEIEASTQIQLPPVDAFLQMNDKEFGERFGHTVFARAGLDKLKSNIQAIKAHDDTAISPKLKAS
ncbi:MAG: tRNA epoxyqueuosine(34) reductase QueG [Desulfobacteraceae bacterium]|jgi:epoxyqueuosine reductase